MNMRAKVAMRHLGDLDDADTVLTGRRIQAAWVTMNDEWAKDEPTIYLETDQGFLRLVAVGDCCAHAFYQGVCCSEALVDATVTKVEDLKCESNDNAEDHGVTDTWGHRIHTTRGICTIDMRTEHNGYYSGHIEVYDAEALPPSAKPLRDFS